MYVNVDIATNRRERALWTCLAGVDPAVNTDWSGGIEVHEIETIGVYGALSVADLAAQTDGKNLTWLAETCRVMFRGP